MKDKHWAVFALRDIKDALDAQRYDVACCHINDAIEALLARDAQDDTLCAPSVRRGDKMSNRI